MAALVTVSFASATPTRASWAKAANVVCATADGQVRALPVVTVSTFLSDSIAWSRIGETTVKAFDAIPRPQSEAGTIATMATIEEKEELLLRASIAAYERGPAFAKAWAKTYGAKASAMNTHFNALARQVGANVCAENPSPSGGATIA